MKGHRWITRQLIFLFAAFFAAACLLCGLFLWGYGSNQAFWQTGRRYQDLGGQFKWLFSQQGQLSAPYFDGALNDLAARAQEDGAHLYLFKNKAQGLGGLFLSPLGGDGDLAGLYRSIPAEELAVLLSAAQSTREGGALAIFSQKRLQPVIFLQSLGEGQFACLISPQLLLHLEPGFLLFWGLCGFWLFVGGAACLLAACGARLAKAERDLQAELAHTRRLRENTRRLLACLSHDIKTPVALISSNLQAWQDGLYPGGEQELYQNLKEEGSRLCHLTDRLLTLARMDADLPGLRPTLFNLYDLAMECCRHFSVSLQTKSLRVERPEYGEYFAMADYDTAAQAVLNLMENAVEHTPDGGVLRLGFSAGGGFVKMELFNTCPSLPPEECGRLFEPFYRNDPARLTGGHHGLGLAIVKSAAQRLGGGCGCEPRPGGLCFFLLLPAGRAP